MDMECNTDQHKVWRIAFGGLIMVPTLLVLLSSYGIVWLYQDSVEKEAAFPILTFAPRIALLTIGMFLFGELILTLIATKQAKSEQ